MNCPAVWLVARWKTVNYGSMPISNWTMVIWLLQDIGVDRTDSWTSGCLQCRWQQCCRQVGTIWMNSLQSVTVMWQNIMVGTTGPSDQFLWDSILEAVIFSLYSHACMHARTHITPYTPQTHTPAYRCLTNINLCLLLTDVWDTALTYINPCFLSTDVWDTTLTHVNPCFLSTDVWDTALTYINPCVLSTDVWATV